MASGEHEQYTIRRQIFKVFGAGFHVYDASGAVVAYCKQKAFRLREDFRVYTDTTQTTELLRIGTNQIIDFGATYTVSVPDAGEIGSFTRRGMNSFVRDEWQVRSADGAHIATVRETGSMAPFLRRFTDMSFLFPQSFEVVRESDGAVLGIIRQHFNLLIYRLGVAILIEDESLDDLMFLAGGCLIAAIEGRQD